MGNAQNNEFMKILYICPTREWLRMKSSDDKPKGSLFLRLPSLSAAILKALTPSEHEFELIDEQIDFLDTEKPVDLVAITCNTATSSRAYEIAKIYQSKNIPVILGGVHPSLCQAEASQYGSVIIGSAEPVWQHIINDLKKGNIKPIYESNPEDVKLIKPDRSVYDGKGFVTTNLVETSRGCVYNCDFCSTAAMYKSTHVTKDIADVIEEIKSLDGDIVFFVDDNLIGNIPHAKELFKALIPLKIRWISQVTYLLGRDRELLELAKQSGCIGVFIGFDAPEDETLIFHNKKFGKIAAYEEAIKNIHAAGILIQGGFVFGSDAEDKSTFRRTFDFIQRNKIDGVFFGIYTPLPNTPVHDFLSDEGRIIDEDYNNYDYRHSVFEPKNMTPAELFNGVEQTLKNFFRKDRIFVRFFRTLGKMIRRRSVLLFIAYYLAFLSRIKLLRKLRTKSST
jgi:radical SAM superfamily enzyme YgiQ (UPF0313 family)